MQSLQIQKRKRDCLKMSALKPLHQSTIDSYFRKVRRQWPTKKSKSVVSSDSSEESECERESITQLHCNDCNRTIRLNRSSKCESCSNHYHKQCLHEIQERKANGKTWSWHCCNNCYSKMQKSEEKYGPIECQICGSPEEDSSMLLCDKCDCGYHMFCLRPILVNVPQGDWFCPKCSKSEHGEFVHQMLSLFIYIYSKC